MSEQPDAGLRNRIAAAIAESDGIPSFEFVAKLHRTACLREADAVLAVLPAPADRAAVLREAADAMDAHCEQYGVLGVGDRLRRMADDLQRPATPDEQEPHA